MCIGLPAKVINKVSADSAVIDASGAKRTVSTELLGELEPGDYVIVHEDTAIAKITKEDHDEAEALLKKIK